MLALPLDCTIVKQCAVIQIFVVTGGKTLQDSKKNVTTIWRKLYHAEECIPMGGKVPK
jgi:hypothetical protein